jgi:protein-S-isoprenylcysteine O-methyltransferase Ste14
MTTPDRPFADIAVTIIAAVRDAPGLVARLFSWAGALLFFVSLACFLFSYLLTYGMAASGTPDAAAVTWNVMLFTIFALHHSVFARTGIREWVARTFPAHLERSIYVWIASILFLVVCAWWQPIAGVLWEVRGAAAWPLWLLQAAGVWLTLKSAAILNVRDLAGIAPAGSPVPASSALIEYRTTGPYGWVRHPIYAGWFLMVLPTPRMTMTRLVFAVVSCVYLLLAIPLEEGTMRRGPDGAYERYMRQVRWKLIPGVY